MWRSALVLLSRSIPNPRARVKLHVDAPAVRPAPATSPKRPTQPARMEANRVAAPSSSSPAEGTAATNDGSAQPRVPVYRPGRWDIWILGISIGLGGQYFSWNEGLKSGLYTFLIEYFLVGFAYIALCCCTSEITGALPFAGGAYGLSRCTLGFYPGFIIGCAEAIEYIIYVATSVLALADMFVESIPELDGFEPLIWLLVYASALFFHIRGDYVFWRWNIVIGVLSLFFVLLYCIGSFPHTNFALNADNDPDFRFVHGTHGFMRSLPLACWFFVGVEALNLASDDVVDPKRSIPFAQLSCILSLFLSGIVVFFVTVSLPPPGLNQVSKLLAPFDNGFQLLFTISVKTATLFSIPAMYATTFGFMWGYGKLIAAMATSKLLPPIIARPHPMYQTPYLAVLLGSTLSYFMCLLVFYVPQILDKYLFNICIAMAFIGYAGQCIGYISLKRNYPNIKSSTFHSPFGNYGAVYSLIIWLIGLVSVAGFQENGGIEILVFGGIIFVLTLFYFGYAQSRQTLSSKENKVFLMAHVMKFGKSRKKQYSSQMVPHYLTAGGGSPTRLTAATGLVRPALSLPHLGGRDGSNHQSKQPLQLPTAKPLPNATPFYLQFSSPRLEDPYGDNDPFVFLDPNEAQAASHTATNVQSSETHAAMATAFAPTVDAALAASDGIAPSEDTVSIRRASAPGNEITTERDNLKDRSAGVPARETLEDLLGVSPSEDVDEHSEVYSDDARRKSGMDRSIDGGRSPWMSTLGDRFTTFILTNIGIVNELEFSDSPTKELSSVTPDMGDATGTQRAEDTNPQDS